MRSKGGWAGKQTDLRPVYHRKRDRIVAHVQLCWLALLLIRTAETAAGETWRNLAHELGRIRLSPLATTPRVQRTTAGLRNARQPVQ